DLPAFLPEEYVIDTDVRLNLYRRLSALVEKTELAEIAEEIQDRFGPPPVEVKNLLALMSVRILLKKMGVIRMDVGVRSLTLTFAPHSSIDTEKLLAVVGDKPNRFRFLSQDKLRIHTENLSDPVDLEKVENYLSEIEFQ
ncbi:MAG: hypothetical protein DRH37_01780, partial [Deltaproteobacteria bacterium]